MNATTLEHLERTYQTCWQKREDLRFRLAERRTSADAWAHDGGTDAETLRQLDDLGLRQAGQIAAAHGVDVAAVVAEVEERMGDNEPGF